MDQKVLSTFFIISLLFSNYITMAAAVPATRSFALGGDNTSDTAKNFQDSGDEGVVDMELEGIEEARVVMEMEDYPRTGANKAHDPKSPGRG